VRSIAIVLRAILAGVGRADIEPVRGTLETIKAAVNEIGHSFDVLEHFQTASSSELHSAIKALGEAHARVLESLRTLGKEIGCPASYWQARTADRDTYNRGILSSLFESFQQARQAEPSPVSA
jgi:hypothetical protein